MGHFSADAITLNNWDQIFKVRKKSVIVHATQICFPEGFTVTTKEGVMYGKPYDWLVWGVQGEKYIVDKDIFAETYEIVEQCMND